LDDKLVRLFLAVSATRHWSPFLPSLAGVTRVFVLTLLVCLLLALVNTGLTFENLCSIYRVFFAI